MTLQVMLKKDLTHQTVILKDFHQQVKIKTLSD